MKLKLSTYFLGIIIVCVSCTSNKVLKHIHYSGQIQRDVPDQPKLFYPCIINTAQSWRYFCSSHYEDFDPAYKTANIRKICTCEFSDSLLMEIALDTKVRGEGWTWPSIQCVFLYDSTFVSNYILPLFKKEEDRKEIEYTLFNADESTFDTIIDFEHKVIINEDAYYFPIKCKKFVYVRIDNELEWLKTVIPQEKWIYCRNCYNEDVNTLLLVPLL